MEQLLNLVLRERLVIRPTSASRSSVVSQSAGDERIRIKRATLDYYGLGVDMTGDNTANWTARTMTSSATVPFADCTLSHIWPQTMSDAADTIAEELKLPERFYEHPRNFLVLPKPLEVAFDKMGVVLIPNRSGDIVVRRWATTRLSRDEEREISKFYGQVLDWPTRAQHQPHLPFMRLMAFRVFSASKHAPAATSTGALGDEDLLNVSQDETSREALRSVVGRLGLMVQII